MSQTFGIEAPGKGGAAPQDGAGIDDAASAPPARYLILIDSASAARRLARVLLDSKMAVAEFDASAPEVQLMTKGLAFQRGAEETQWDAALSGHSRSEREAAEVYTLDA